ncbi:MAG: HlyD family efflux transporter periplasmic adaptor subunit [Azospirillum sp.]|nr:HlyD family efflux transporter periplasmic adaptor subunit [Azospirillum sp.]
MDQVHQILALLSAWVAGLGLFASGTTGALVLNGYADADWVRPAAEVAGQIVELAVMRGERVEPGTVLFRLDDLSERATRAEAAARLAAAEAQLANLKTGKRPAEIDVIRAQVAEAKARLTLMELRLDRRQVLTEKKVMAPEGLDEARADVNIQHAQVAALEAQIAVALLPARADEIAAAEAQVVAAQATLDHAEQALAKRVVRASAAARVDDVLHWPGEQVASGAAVLVLLPDGGNKVRAFVPETRLGEIALGAPVRLDCDGCGDGLPGRISFIADQAEYTPPVIYSVGSREKLVFLIEVRPVRDPQRLHPGQPIDIRLEPAR